jgi:hypothetical protein
MDPHWFGSLDPDPELDLHRDKNLDPDPIRIPITD